jgi:predicted dehydrogenase
VAVMYGDAFCASPVVDELLGQIGTLRSPPTHLSSRSILPAPVDTAVAGSPMTFHGTSSIAVLLLVARLCGLGHPRQVVARTTVGVVGAPGATDLELRFGSGPVATVHAAWGPPGAPVRDVQVATAEEVWRVDAFPTPTLERNGAPLGSPIGAAAGGDPIYALGYIPQLRSFWLDVTAGRPPVLPAAFGREVLEVLTAGERSAAADAPVALPLS